MKNSKQKVLNSFKNIASALELVSNLVRTEKLRRLKTRKFTQILYNLVISIEQFDEKVLFW